MVSACITVARGTEREAHQLASELTLECVIGSKLRWRHGSGKPSMASNLLSCDLGLTKTLSGMQDKQSSRRLAESSVAMGTSYDEGCLYLPRSK